MNDLGPFYGMSDDQLAADKAQRDTDDQRPFDQTPDAPRELNTLDPEALEYALWTAGWTPPTLPSDGDYDAEDMADLPGDVLAAYVDGVKDLLADEPLSEALAALRARPTLDREAIAKALWTDDWRNGYADADRYEELVGTLAEDAYLSNADAVLALLAAVGQDTPEPEWTDPEPWWQAPGGFRHARQENVSGVPRFQYKPRTREQYDAERDS